jgi:type I restriction enzyme S subunit
MSDATDWEYRTIGEIAKLAGGSAFKEVHQGGSTGEIPFIKVSDFSISENYKYIVRANNWISYETSIEIGAKVFPPGAVVFPKVGAALLSNRRRILSAPTAIDNNLMAAIPIDCHPEFLHIALCEVDFTKFVQDGAVPSINQEQVSSVEIAVPPLPEQKKIAEILSGIDRAIAKLIYKSQKLDTLQASLTEEFVQKLQGKMDLAELQEYAEVRTGVAKNAKSEGDMTEMPYMRVANVQDGYLDFSEIKTISIDRGRIQRYLLQTGDVLINEGGDLDKVGRGVIWRGVIKECLHQNHVFAVRCSRRLTPEFLSLLLKSSYSKNYFLGCAKQTTNLASINSTQLKQFPIPVPDLRTQEQFISHITSVKALNSAITNEISGLEATKKAVASVLLSGRKRVSV